MRERKNIWKSNSLAEWSNKGGRFFKWLAWDMSPTIWKHNRKMIKTIKKENIIKLWSSKYGYRYQLQRTFRALYGHTEDTGLRLCSFKYFISTNGSAEY